MRFFYFAFIATVSIAYSCTPTARLRREANRDLLGSAALQHAHTGITIFDPSTGKYLFDHNGDRYFVPASNTKIPTCYAAMKYLGDSLDGLKYAMDTVATNRRWLWIQPTGDPTFLHPDFKKQPVMEWLESKLADTSTHLGIADTLWKENHWGSGWSWSDYDAAYMAERSPFPIFGNVITFRPSTLDERLEKTKHRGNPVLITSGLPYFDSLVKTDALDIINESGNLYPRLSLRRELASNVFTMAPSKSNFLPTAYPFVTNGSGTASLLLADTLHRQTHVLEKYGWKNWHTVHSQPTDSLLQPMMHRSDNFFAEQSLLMVSNKLLGIMNDARIIDTLLKKDLSDLPQKPRWVDGSGLSRYNLFTPRDMVAILKKMHAEFGAERLQQIFATGNEGTLSGYYKKDSGYLWAKTGTLSGVVAISGWMYTQKHRLLFFSVLVNNHTGSATPVRRSIEAFIQKLRERY